MGPLIHFAFWVDSNLETLVCIGNQLFCSGLLVSVRNCFQHKVTVSETSLKKTHNL